MKGFLHIILLLPLLMIGCGEHKSCRETAALYEFTLGLPVVADTMEVNDLYRIDYTGELFDKQNDKIVTEINPLFAIKLSVYLVDTSNSFPVLKIATDNFEVNDWVTGTFAGRNNKTINLHILSNNNNGFSGGIVISPKVPGWYLIDVVPEEVYPVLRGSNLRCEKVDIIRYQLLSTADPFGNYYDELHRASTFKPKTQRMIWVK